MTKHLMTSAAFAGLASGLLAALLQFWFVTPLLMEGELYETGARIHFPVNGSPQSEAGAPPVWTDWTRNFNTLAMNLVTYTGFAFLLVAGFALAERFGHRVDARKGAIWGLCAAIAFQLAPAFGLPPELPGTVGANLAARQAWWIGCVVSTGAGIAVIAFARGAPAMAAGALLLALPHLIEAPHLDAYYGVAAPELAAHFATRAIGVGAAAWVLLGLMAGALWARRG